MVLKAWLRNFNEYFNIENIFFSTLNVSETKFALCSVKENPSNRFYRISQAFSYPILLFEIINPFFGASQPTVPLAIFVCLCALVLASTLTLTRTRTLTATATATVVHLALS